MTVSIIVPCYNEADNLLALRDAALALALAKSFDLEWVLVENGSTDDSREIFKRDIEGRSPQIRTVYIDQNQGYGFGIKQGLVAARGELLGWYHADLQVPPPSLSACLHAALSASADFPVFVKGLRPASRRSPIERVFTAGMSIFDSLLFCRRLYDVGAYPVIFSRALLTHSPLEYWPNNFAIEIYAYQLAARSGFHISRVPVEIRQRERGASSWNSGLSSRLKQSLRIMRDSIKIRIGAKIS